MALYPLYVLHPLDAFDSRPITPDSGHPLRLPDHSPLVTTQVFAIMQTCVII